MSFISFIIPSLGRETLTRALQSLLDQTDPGWTALVVADHVKDFRLPLSDPRILSVNLPEKLGLGEHLAGQIRNIGMQILPGLWHGFLDDDDRLDRKYVQWLKEEADDRDAVIFRMIYASPRTEDGALILPNGRGLLDGYVGISFAVRSAFMEEKKVAFESEECEDCHLLQRMTQAGARLRWSPRIAYYIRH